MDASEASPATTTAYPPATSPSDTTSSAVPPIDSSPSQTPIGHMKPGPAHLCADFRVQLPFAV